jgi:p-aminobenzoyl-glutamate transporter AbgT
VTKRHYMTAAIVVVIVLVLYYVIDYAVVSSNVRKHVESALSTTIQSVGQLTPAQFNALVPAGVSQDRLYINEDNRWLVVDPNSVFVKQRIEYDTWSALNQDHSSPICLMNIVNMSLVPGNTSMLVSTNVRFVGPFGIPRSIAVIETQSVKEFPIQ